MYVRTVQFNMHSLVGGILRGCSENLRCSLGLRQGAGAADAGAAPASCVPKQAASNHRLYGPHGQARPMLPEPCGRCSTRDPAKRRVIGSLGFRRSGRPPRPGAALGLQLRYVWNPLAEVATTVNSRA